MHLLWCFFIGDERRISMAVNEEIVTGRKFRKLIDEVNKIWQRISFWTKASDVEFDDAKTAEIKVGAIDGITDSLASTSSRIAASAKSVNQLSNDLGGLKFGIDSDGNYGYYKDGADTVTPFSYGIAEYIDGNMIRKATTDSVVSVSKTYTATSKGILLIFCSLVYLSSYSDVVKLNGAKISPVSTKTQYQCRVSLYSISIEKGDKITISASASNESSSNESIHAAYFMVLAK